MTRAVSTDLQETGYPRAAGQGPSSAAEAVAFCVRKDFLQAQARPETLTAPSYTVDPLGVRLVRITGARLDEAEQLLAELQAVYCSLHSGGGVPGGGQLLYVLEKRDGMLELYLGIAGTGSPEDAAEQLRGLLQSLQGHLPGLASERLDAARTRELLARLQAAPHVACLTGIPSAKSPALSPGGKPRFQGVEQLVGATGGEDFTLAVVARPVLDAELRAVERSAVALHDEVAQLREIQLQEAESRASGDEREVVTSRRDSTLHEDSRSARDCDWTGAEQEARTEHSREDTSYQGRHDRREREETCRSSTQTSTETKHNLLSRAFNWVKTSLFGGKSLPEKREVEDTTSLDTRRRVDERGTEQRQTERRIESEANTSGHRSEQARERRDARARENSVEEIVRQRSGATRTRTVSVERSSAAAARAVQLLDQLLERLELGRGLGLWQVSTFLMSASPSGLTRLERRVRGLFAGATTVLEPMRAVRLPLHIGERCLRSLAAPRAGAGAEHPLGPLFTSAATALTTPELTLLASLPSASVPGLLVELPVAFGREAGPRPPPGEALPLGRLVDRGEPSTVRVGLAPASLTGHTFLTGLTGSGKTTTAMALLRGLRRLEPPVPFLVIEPSKLEYRALRHEFPDLLVLAPGHGDGATPLRLNPFDFLPPTTPGEHVDWLVHALESVLPTYPVMPIFLRKALSQVYLERGWSLVTGRNCHEGPSWRREEFLPTLAELVPVARRAVESMDYGAELRMNLTAALEARLGSLIQGARGALLDTRAPTDFLGLMSRPVVVELDSVGSNEEKTLWMSLLLEVVRAVCRARGPRAGELVHLTVVEEAHRVLRRAPESHAAEYANPAGHAAEAFAAALAELRAYGEGILVIDQLPSKLLPEAVKGTNVKLVHRLAAGDDRQLVGDCLALASAQVEEIARLPVGRAVVHHGGLREPVLVQIEPPEPPPENLAACAEPLPDRPSRFRAMAMARERRVTPRLESLFDRVLLYAVRPAATPRLLRAFADYGAEAAVGVWDEEELRAFSQLLAERVAERARALQPDGSHDRIVELRLAACALLETLHDCAPEERPAARLAIALRAWMPLPGNPMVLFSHRLLCREPALVAEALRSGPDGGTDLMGRLREEREVLLDSFLGTSPHAGKLRAELGTLLAAQLLAVARSGPAGPERRAR